MFQYVHRTSNFYFYDFDHFNFNSRRNISPCIISLRFKRRLDNQVASQITYPNMITLWSIYLGEVLLYLLFWSFLHIFWRNMSLYIRSLGFKRCFHNKVFTQRIYPNTFTIWSTVLHLTRNYPFLPAKNSAIFMAKESNGPDGLKLQELDVTST